jgi:tetratricopeptide (TPR) repeat protein/tRNA A-37 threonylcarbamoyl transferase component Bud32
MSAESRIQEVLEQIMDVRCTPEEACAKFPELLPEVRRRWNQLQVVEHQVGLFFPSSIPVAEDGTILETQAAATRLPQIDGYEVQTVLGRGGMGVVYRARHLKLNRAVALKMLLSGAYAGPQELVRFQREAEAVAGLRHANIVQVYDIGELHGRPYFTMEFIEGGSLAESLAGTPQPARHAAVLVAKLAEAVQVAHQGGIIHRDLKPANVLLTVDGTPKITDFGLARRFEGEAQLTLSGARIGTPSYMAPEQAAGKVSAVGPAADVYALGAILYEMLTGRPPFRAETVAETERQVIAEEPVSPSRLNPKVPRDLETICLKCLHKDPLRRYATAAALAGDLQRFQRGEAVMARRTGVVELAAKWANRHRALTTAIAGGALLSISLLALGWWIVLQRTVVARAVEEDFRQLVQAQQRSSWAEARTALERAKARLGDVGARDRHPKIRQFERELDLVTTVDDIRMNRLVESSEGNRFTRAAAAYEQAFGQASLFDLNEQADVVAARIRTTGIAPAVVVALDDWAGCGVAPARREWLSGVAQQVAPDPTRLQIRDFKLWDDREALERFAKESPIADQSVALLINISQQLTSLGGDAIPLLKRLQESHPSDFWANLMLGLALHGKKDFLESIRYYQAAIAIRPNVAVPYGNLGTALTDVGRVDEALEQFRIASRLDPGATVYRYNIALALHGFRRDDESIQELRRILDLDPESARTYSLIGHCLTALNRFDEAIDEHRRAVVLEPNRWEAHRGIIVGLLKLNRLEEARAAWKHTISLQPPEHYSFDGYAELCLFLGHDDEYRLARRALLDRFGSSTDPLVAERAGRACLFLPASDVELQQISTLLDRALSADRSKYGRFLPYFRFAKGLAEYRAGRPNSALALLEVDTLKVLGPAPHLLLAMVQHRLGQTDAARKSFDAAVATYDWNVTHANDREAWMYHFLRREAESLIQPDTPKSSDGS